ncbi:hypothetical protein [Thermoflavimicrobium daqui]|uniref:Uncharacterized protein n=1 Tax=Thermoflavimicrobium daqui TaxID=2137476 RepID=A0A364K8T4_9BACL|nr:hypothetical protein [Thermoflavimicrobium daqui]RAL26707.1 hypothetical protein DL897_01255 [Thermoflavimicrobium daqui]
MQAHVLRKLYLPSGMIMEDKQKGDLKYLDEKHYYYKSVFTSHERYRKGDQCKQRILDDPQKKEWHIPEECANFSIYHPKNKLEFVKNRLANAFIEELGNDYIIYLTLTGFVDSERYPYVLTSTNGQAKVEDKLKIWIDKKTWLVKKEEQSIESVANDSYMSLNMINEYVGEIKEIEFPQ